MARTKDSDPVRHRTDEIAEQLAEQGDALDAVGAGFVSVAHALLLAGVTEHELHRLLAITLDEFRKDQARRR